MTTEEHRRRGLRKKLAAHLGLADVPAAAWRALERAGRVDEALNWSDEEEAVGLLGDQAKPVLEAVNDGRRKHPGRSCGPSAELADLTPGEREYAETLSACLASHLGAAGPVRAFRDCYLGGLHTEASARRFMFRGPTDANLWLAAVANWLRQHYRIPCWEPGDAEMFVLTGKLWLSPVQWSASGGRIGPLAPLTLTIMPFVSAKTVERVYRDIQRQVLEGEDNRRVEARALAVFRFVTERRVAGDGAARWARWMREWNHAHRDQPAWQFSDRSAFRRVLQRAEKVFRPRSSRNVFFRSTETSTPNEPPPR
jgi:hypothetical protein